MPSQYAPPKMFLPSLYFPPGMFLPSLVLPPRGFSIPKGGILNLGYNIPLVLLPRLKPPWGNFCQGEDLACYTGLIVGILTSNLVRVLKLTVA